MKRFVNLIDRMADISGYIAGWLVPIMIILIVYEVFMRYVLHNPPMVADEFSAYMLVALSYMGLSYTWRQGGHIRITLLVHRLPTQAANWIRLIGLILSFVFLVGVNHSAFKMIIYANKIDLKSDTWLTFPLFWPQLMVFIGFLLLLLTLFSEITKVVKNIQAGENVEGISK